MNDDYRRLDGAIPDTLPVTVRVMLYTIASENAGVERDPRPESEGGGKEIAILPRTSRMM